MYKILSINGKDYKLEYTIEAALYKDGVDRLIDFLSGTLGVQSEEKLTEGLSDEDKNKVRVQLVKNLKSETTNLPNTALTLFYAGLLEYHGEDGDKSVQSLKDAKHLVKQLFMEPETTVSDFAELLAVCMEQMGEDGFFKRTGLETLAKQVSKEAENQEIPKPNRATRRAQAKISDNKSKK